MPTTAEFEYAASGGAADRLYPWGDDAPAGRANFDPQGDRAFNRWADFLQPAATGEPNAFGLRGMSGNVWQMAIARADPAIATFRYRMDDPDLLETALMGGSWARTVDYLQRGAVEGLGSGIRYPDAGFRPVRAPSGQDWRLQPRRLTAIAQGQKGILLGWSVLADDPPGRGFHVYRAASREHDGFRITTQPITDRSTYLDGTADGGRRFHYYVCPVDATGRPGRRSEWIGVTASDVTPTNAIVTFELLYRQGGLVPVFGDLLEPFPRNWTPLEWDGDPTRELMSTDARVLGDFDGRQVVLKKGVLPNTIEKSSVIMVADLYGDFRDELVLTTPTAKGGKAVTVIMAADEIPFRYEGALEEREYRYWIARNKGGAYASIHDRKLVRK